ncbi:MAG: hypothetical protein FD169_2153 [Bacillota bacterium]|nr:MAG: hypothetical protein FD169_2153 [Bacillota bacterium]
MRQQIESALTVVGAVVGAGFASGREVYHFFSRYGANGLLGVVVAMAVLCLLCMRVLALAEQYRAKTLAELMQMHLGVRVNNLLSRVLLGVLWLGLGIMLSGAAAAGESLGINKIVTLVVTSILIAACLYSGIAGIKKANALLIPILIAVSSYLFWCGMEHGSYSFLIVDTSVLSWAGSVWSAILYAGLNSLLVFVVIPPLAIEDKPTGVLLGCALFAVMLLGTTVLLLQFPVLSAESPVPILSIIADIAPRMPEIYGVILWTALTTTALANGLGMQTFVETRLQLNRFSASVLVVASSLPVALLPFTKLVAIAYTGLGYVALVLAVAMLKPSR